MAEKIRAKLEKEKEKQAKEKERAEKKLQERVKEVAFLFNAASISLTLTTDHPTQGQ
jgi:hypothetical protein